MKKQICLLLFITLSLKADQLFFAFYNDFFAGKDQHFTNGAALCWLDENDNNITDFDFSGFILDGVKNVGIDLDASKNYNAGISLSQIIATPSDTTKAFVQYDDMPYAGYLALSTYLFEWDSTSFYEYRLELGVVGKESLAGEVQTSFHYLIGNSAPEGWKTQLKSSPIVNTLFRYAKIAWQYSNNQRFQADWINHTGFTLGNFYTGIFAGTMFRFGENYIRNFNIHYPYLREEASLISLENMHKGFGWSFNIGLNTEFLAYSYILDEAKAEGYQTDKESLNTSAYLGMDFYYGAHKITFFYQSQSPYTKEQNTFDIFGGFIYAYRF